MSPIKVASIAIPLLLILCTYGGETAPLFGIGSFLSTLTSAEVNGTDLLTALALAHIQHTINKIDQFSELLELGSAIATGTLTG